MWLLLTPSPGEENPVPDSEMAGSPGLSMHNEMYGPW